jgi:uncharacterized membrane protein
MADTNGKNKASTPWRFRLFFAVLAIGWGLGVWLLGWAQGLLVGFDVAALLFLVLQAPLFAEDAKALRKAAIRNDANRMTLLVVSFLLSVVILSAVVAELGQASQLTAIDKAVVAASLVIVWVFGNAVYTLHYAHLFYTADGTGKDTGGLDFPGTKEPLMADFVYFAFTLGVAVQTSDVVIKAPHIRKVVTAHCVAGFFFNLGVLALTINVLAAS